MNSNDNFGKIAKDKVTGFKGMITAKAVYMYGCVQFCLVPQVDKEGKILEGQWFDEGRIEVIGDGIEHKSVVAELNGGPQRDAPKN